MPIDLQLLKNERDQLKTSLRDIEAEQRKLDSQVKQLRQREIRARRELEALGTLIDVNTPQDEAAVDPQTDAHA